VKPADLDPKGPRFQSVEFSYQISNPSCGLLPNRNFGWAELFGDIPAAFKLARLVELGKLPVCWSPGCDRSINGVTLYEMVTGSLPFTAYDPMEWAHCHIARKPVAPIEQLETIPPPVSAIIMKLLAKTAEERYQTAAGAESDLQRCLAEWENGRAGVRPTRLSCRKTLIAC
jgi:serine/threonine protein kinase